MSAWKIVKIGDILKRIKRPVVLEDNKEYKLVTVKLHHKGVALRECKKGCAIGSKMYEVKNRDFILSGIDARNGAFGIVGEDLDGAIVTNDFWYFELNDELIDKHFFLELTSTQWFDEICRLGSDGTTQRIRLQKDRFFNQEIRLPSIEKQREFSKKFLLLKAEKQKLNDQNNVQQSHLTLLRQQILQDAISGKLTADWRAQNPNTEPANRLLDQIKAEKEKLIGEKKIKKEKALPPISKDEMPFELPEGWEWCRLGEIIVMNYGSGLTKHQRITEGKYPVFGSNGIVGYHDEFLTEHKAIIIGRKGSAGAINISEDPSWTTDVAYFVEETQNLDFKYLKYLLQSLGLDSLGKGIKPGLNRNEAYGLPLPLPPRAEQGAIVGKVDRLLGYVAQLEEKNANNANYAELLMQAFLWEVFKQ